LPAGLGIVIALVAGLTATESGIRRGEAAMTAAAWFVPCGLLMCLGLGFKLARGGESRAWSFFGTLIFGALLTILNLTVGFTACLFLSAAIASV
jgi:hypothetical protein